MLRWLWATLWPPNPRPPSTSGFEIIDESRQVDEECLAHYNPSRFYPVYVGDTFESRYQVLTKLGYGSCSTVWLCRDITFVISFPLTHISPLTQLSSKHKYVALKVCISKYPSIEREHAAYIHLREALRTHLGSLESALVRSSLADFELPGVEGLHQCFVFDPLTIDLVATRAAVPFDEVLFKNTAFYVFCALDFLHNKAQMVHCGVSLFMTHDPP